nr:hypothetical protein [Tanacetum cinerariifolium]
MESSDQFICFFCGSLSDEYGCPCSTCELYGNDAHYGYNCPSQVSFVYNQDPCFNQNLDNFPQTSPSFPQQYLCCENCGGPHATFDCQPMNQNFYEPNFCYNSDSFGFDQFQPPQYPVIHQPRQEMSTEMLLAKEKLIKAIQTCLKNNNQPPEEKSIAILLAEESILTVMQTLEEKQIDTESMQELLLQLSKDLQNLGNTSNQLKQEEQDSSQYWKPPVYYSDDDDNFYREKIESSVKKLNVTPSESGDLSDYVSECDLPFCDNSPNFNNDSEIFSNPLFDSKDDYTSSDDESSSEEDVPVEHFKIYSNLLLEFDKEIFSNEINPLYNEVLEDLDPIPLGNENDHFNVESDLIESLINKDTVLTSLKIDFLLEGFTGELTLINPIPPGIFKTNFDPKAYIRVIKKLLYDNSSPCPLEELNSKNDFVKENSGSTTIHTDISLPEYESFYDESDSASDIFNDDLAHIISPSEYEYVYADDESDSGDLTTKVVDDISDNSTRKLYVYVPNILTTLPTLYPVFDTLLLISSENKDKFFNPGILISKEEKSPILLSHRGLKVFQLINDPETR